MILNKLLFWMVSLFSAFMLCQYSVKASTVLTVDLIKKTTIPEDPIANIAVSNSVLIKVVADGDTPSAQDFPLKDQKREFNGIPLETDEGEIRTSIYFSAYTEEDQMERSSNDWAEGDCYMLIIKPTRDYKNRMPSTKFPLFVKNGFNTGIIYSDEENLGITIQVAKWKLHDGENEGDKQYYWQETLYAHSFPLRVIKRNHLVSWSTGISFLGIRDKKYHLDSIKDDQDHKSIAFSGYGNYPYKLSAFVHYSIAADFPLSYTFGLASDVPITHISAMLGLSYSFRTLPAIDSGNFFLGVAYSQRNVLKDGYKENDIIASDTQLSDLIEESGAFGVVVGITFNFPESEEKFKSLFSQKP